MIYRVYRVDVGVSRFRAMRGAEIDTRAIHLGRSPSNPANLSRQNLAAQVNLESHLGKGGGFGG